MPKDLQRFVAFAQLNILDYLTRSLMRIQATSKDCWKNSNSSISSGTLFNKSFSKTASLCHKRYLPPLGIVTFIQDSHTFSSAEIQLLRILRFVISQCNKRSQRVQSIC